jgi:hypothetical protein
MAENLRSRPTLLCLFGILITYSPANGTIIATTTSDPIPFIYRKPDELNLE